MANYKQKRRRTWHFSNSGNRFNGKQRPLQNVGRPISPAFKRGIRRCKRCGNRVVSNLSHCPFCGKSLLPLFKRLWVWLIVVIVLGVGVFLLVFINLPESDTELPHPNAETPFVIGAAEGASLKNLSYGTSIDAGGLQVKVITMVDGPLDMTDTALKVLNVEFFNTSDESVTLYATQWILELEDGSRVNVYIGSTADGQTVLGNFEAYELAAGGRFVGQLYFAGTGASAILYQPTPVDYEESLLVSWKVPKS